MKKILTYLFIITYISSFFILYMPSYAATKERNLSKIENDIYGYEYNKDSTQKRVERLERSIYGKISTGDINTRIKKLSADISADVIGLEIPPVEDTFKEEDEIIADNSVNYPIVNEIEQKLFNQTYKNRDLHTRIVTIEKKLFGKIYDVDDYSTRMDRIKAKIMPDTIAQRDSFEGDRSYFDNGNYYDNNALSSLDLAGTGQSRFSMPYGQRNYTRPYANYGDFTGGASGLNENYYNPNLNDELAQMEYETFGTEFSNDDTTTRIKRLNSVNQAQKSSSKYDSNKFNQRMSTVMEIGAMLLMILAMVL